MVREDNFGTPGQKKYLVSLLNFHCVLLHQLCLSSVLNCTVDFIKRKKLPTKLGL